MYSTFLNYSAGVVQDAAARQFQFTDGQYVKTPWTIETFAKTRSGCFKTIRTWWRFTALMAVAATPDELRTSIEKRRASDLK